MEIVPSQTAERVGILQCCALFSDLEPEDRESLAELVSLRAFEPGETLFSEGEPAKGFYVLVEGEAKICRYSAGGREQILHLFGSGEPCGEVPMFRGEPFPATAVAIGGVKAIYIPRTGFLDLGRRRPELLIAMLAVLSVRLVHFVNLVDSLSLGEVSTRLARYLLNLWRQSGEGECVKLDSTKTLLASRIGTIAETLSRTLARMQKQGIIRVEGDTIEILDVQRLENLAEGEKV